MSILVRERTRERPPSKRIPKSVEEIVSLDITKRPALLDYFAQIEEIPGVRQREVTRLTEITNRTLSKPLIFDGHKWVVKSEVPTSVNYETGAAVPVGIGATVELAACGGLFKIDYVILRLADDEMRVIITDNGNTIFDMDGIQMNANGLVGWNGSPAQLLAHAAGGPYTVMLKFTDFFFKCCSISVSNPTAAIENIDEYFYLVTGYHIT